MKNFKVPKNLTKTEKNTILFSLAMFVSKQNYFSFMQLYNYVLDVYAPGDFTADAIKKVPEDLLSPITAMQIQLVQNVPTILK